MSSATTLTYEHRHQRSCLKQDHRPNSWCPVNLSGLRERKAQKAGASGMGAKEYTESTSHVTLPPSAEQIRTEKCFFALFLVFFATRTCFFAITPSMVSPIRYQM